MGAVPHLRPPDIFTGYFTRFFYSRVQFSERFAQVGLEFEFIGKKAVMFPVWFFLILIGIIGYLLYLTRPNEDSLAMISRNSIRRFQRLIKGRVQS